MNISEAFSTMARIILEKVRSGAEKRGREERSFLCSRLVMVQLASMPLVAAFPVDPPTGTSSKDRTQ